MFFVGDSNIQKKLLLIPILLGVLFLVNAQPDGPQSISAEKVNLALRRTADGLLRLSGDSTSRIPAIEQAGPGVWRVRLLQAFRYEQLPAMLQSSLDVYGIKNPYEVTVRNCENATIDLGFHQTDFLNNGTVPCAGREMPVGCHYIEITFLDSSPKKSLLYNKAGYLFLILLTLGGFWFFRQKKSMQSEITSDSGEDLLEIGNSRLDVAGQVLHCNGVPQSLTFRETKLLRLFANSPDKLLERDFILREVWADEGVLVGRSIDVFVSRLRKKLAADPTVGLVAVHGVGYRLETGKVSVG
ncbi:MAG: winged helix-turn-helix domain-containing protein [Saprospiraceae bacterium]